MFESIVLWLIVGWLVAGLWLVVGAVAGITPAWRSPAAHRGPPAARVPRAPPPASP
jgi:hypothetical protein